MSIGCLKLSLPGGGSPLSGFDSCQFTQPKYHFCFLLEQTCNPKSGTQATLWAAQLLIECQHMLNVMLFSFAAWKQFSTKKRLLESFQIFFFFKTCSWGVAFALFLSEFIILLKDSHNSKLYSVEFLAAGKCGAPQVSTEILKTDQWAQFLFRQLGLLTLAMLMVDGGY